MSRNGYYSIKKYAAFLFVVFTVLSGSTESYSSDILLKAGKNIFHGMNTADKLFTQSIKASIRSLDAEDPTENNEDCIGFYAININVQDVKYIQIHSMPLRLQEYNFNDSITINNTWRCTLF
jgi:hypothetical protein